MLGIWKLMEEEDLLDIVVILRDTYEKGLKNQDTLGNELDTLLGCSWHS
jgi:hypothetical protein